jgi:hypothetical protein
MSGPPNEDGRVIAEATADGVGTSAGLEPHGHGVLG